ncbi:DinB family protein [Paenibacillus sp. MAH-36]|uniref:DinB family protein n=1 Tax=Paenibacillus violae TaxID=3077234 RepID=A0ABU3RKL3_9BACL|nr:DinB family protein [Paenibacillus sp. PFR10]MDU0204844.1 DinB family protein [Paenibacillus sp. PFR10]
MDNIKNLLLGWDRVYEHEDWYPPLKQSLLGLTVEQARWRPETTVNPIWAITSHLIYLKEHFLNVLRGGISAFPEGLTSYDTYNLTLVAEGDENAWAATVERLDKVHKEIKIELAFLTKEDYEQPKEDVPLGHWAIGQEV